MSSDQFLILVVMVTVFAALFCVADMIREFHQRYSKRAAQRRARHPWIVSDRDYPPPPEN
jgi:hypothetical protein